MTLSGAPAIADESLITIQTQSAGFDAGNFATITRNNELLKVERNENKHYRGLHIVIINPENGKVECAKVFDTYKSSACIDNFLFNIDLPEGYIVVAACKDDCVTKMS